MARSHTLAELVTANPASARVFERHQLDYCCGGQQSLEAACAESGVEVAAVLAEIAALEPAGADGSVDWASFGPAQLVDHIEATHHAYLHRELPELSALAAKVLGAHGERHRELVEIAATVDELHADLEPHLLKEERVLFPMIRQLAAAEATPAFHCGSIGNPISVMLAEHEQTGEILARLRTLTGGYAPPVDGCASYRSLFERLETVEADTHLHVHKENNVLFPAVLALERQ